MVHRFAANSKQYNFVSYHRNLASRLISRAFGINLAEDREMV